MNDSPHWPRAAHRARHVATAAIVARWFQSRHDDHRWRQCGCARHDNASPVDGAWRPRPRAVGPPLPTTFDDLCDAVIRRVGILTRVPADAREDFAQDAWTSVLTALEQGRFDPRRGRLEDWLFIVIRNRAVSGLRRHWSDARRQVHLPLDRLASRRFEEPSGRLERAGRIEAVQAAVALLEQRTSSKLFTVFHLRRVCECSVSEVARRLGLTPAQVRVYDHRARRQLEAILRRQGLGEP